MTFFEYWKALHSVLEEHALPATAQLVSYKLLAEFNAAKFPAELALTDRELMRLTNVKSLKSIHDAKAILKQYGLIDFKNRKNKPTVYSLEKFEVNTGMNTKQARSKHEVNTGAAVLIRAGEEEKDEKDRKTELLLLQKRAREEITVNSDEVKQAWFQCEGEHLKGGNALGLIQDEKVYGSEKVVQAIIAASQANTEARLSYNFVHAVLMNQQKKGVKSNDEGRKASRVVSEEWENARPAWLDG